MSKKYNYENILQPKRLRKSTISGREPIDEYFSDRSRIIYSSSFRRLQQKAQVFSLEANSNVRTRLTHSLEVSDIGRTLSRKICIQLQKKGIIAKDSPIPEQIVAIVENACLLHDIGNPPFGHFCEEAIKKWAKEELNKYMISANINNISEDFFSDFIEFDGNPQGLRTVINIQSGNDQIGLNLSYPTLLSCIKYPRKAGEYNKEWRKAGYFSTEFEQIKQIYKDMNMDIGSRYPLSYIMEAADDIAYSLSDIGDGIEKRIITLQDFIEEFEKEWKKYDLELPFSKDITNFNKISIAISYGMIEEATKEYIENHDQVMNGTIKGLFSSENNYYCKVMETIKTVSRKKLYRSYEAESIEISGYAVISGLLKHFGKLLMLKREDFSLFVDDKKIPKDKALDIESRIFNRLSERALRCYKHALPNAKDDTEEWKLRVHLIIDHISGMTDRFALESYKMFEGMI